MKGRYKGLKGLAKSPLTRGYYLLQNRSEGINLRCQVDAKPKSDTFRWLFNSSETRFEIPSAESVMTFGNYKVSG